MSEEEASASLKNTIAFGLVPGHGGAVNLLATRGCGFLS